MTYNQIKPYLNIISEAAYPTNLGAVEVFQIMFSGTPEQIKRLEEITDKNDWIAFKKLVKEILGTNLQDMKFKIKKK